MQRRVSNDSSLDPLLSLFCSSPNRLHRAPNYLSSCSIPNLLILPPQVSRIRAYEKEFLTLVNQPELFTCQWSAIQAKVLNELFRPAGFVPFLWVGFWMSKRRQHSIFHVICTLCAHADTYYFWSTVGHVYGWRWLAPPPERCYCYTDIMTSALPV